jgi:hypothetical protein
VAVGGRLAAVELRGPEPGPVDDVDDPLPGLVAEHPHGDDLGRQALDDVGGLLGSDLPG